MAADEELSGANAANSPTLTARATELGMILGTAAYMAPEQAKGKRVDKRADVWAFGAVLFEMLTGRRAFEGDDVSETLASVLAREPNLAALPPDTPEPVRRMVSRCLVDNSSRMMRVPVRTSPAFSAGTPEALFDASKYFLTTIGRNYDVAPDGRFVMIAQPRMDASQSVPITVVLNWLQELKDIR